MLPARLRNEKPINKMFAKKENRKPTHIAHPDFHRDNSYKLTLRPKIAKECNLAGAQQNTNNLTFNLELN